MFGADRNINYGEMPVCIDLTIAFSADFADIFEVRGQKRARRGIVLPVEIEQMAGLAFSYRGLDNVVRRARVESSLAPCAVTDSDLSIPVQLQPQEELAFSLTVRCESDGTPQTSQRYQESLSQIMSRRASSPIAEVDIYTSNEQFNDWANRSKADLNMLLSATAFGPYPYAGVPWFSTVFGRDGIITALELLWLAPMVAQGVLSYLAAMQATSWDPARDAEPGKILHEIRQGEMAQLREVPLAAITAASIPPRYL